MAENPAPERWQPRFSSRSLLMVVTIVVIAWLFCLLAKGCREYMKHPMPIPKDEDDPIGRATAPLYEFLIFD